MASELRVNTLKDASGNNSVATSVVASGSAKAWVNFNGTGTVAIREDSNVASLTDEGTGDYSISFTSALTDVNYCTNVTSDSNSKNAAARSPTTHTLGTTSAIRVGIYNNAAGTHQDCAVVNIAVQGDLA